MGIAAQCLHGARVCVIPHSTNNYRPYALRHRSLVVVSALLITAKVLALGVVGLMPLPAELSTITSARIVQLTNAERTKAGLNELTINDSLTEAARQKAQDMLNQDYFAHISPTGVTPWFWMSKVNYTYQMAGENLAIDFVEAEDVVSAWMASPTHRENVLQADYVETGVSALTGEFEGSMSTVVVHMFGVPTGQVAPAKVAAEVARVESQPEKAAAIVAPGVPVVSVNNENNVVQDTIALSITGDAGSEVSILVNNQPRAKVTVPGSGLIDQAVSVADMPDGELIIKAVARDGTGKQSGHSVPQVVSKDTQGPKVSQESLTFIASPATDVPAAVVQIQPTADFVSLTVKADDGESVYGSSDIVTIPLTDSVVRLTLFDALGNASLASEKALLPSFYTEADTGYLNSPARFSRVIWRTTFTVAVLILALLSLAVVIQIQIQHPRMITHALFVLVLASALLLF